MLKQTKFEFSDSTYKDGIIAHPYHYQSMRAKPVYPTGLIENNISSQKFHANNWIRSSDEWNYFKKDRQFKMRTLFDSGGNEQIHLRSIDSLSNQHMLDPNVQYPQEDDVFRSIGQKRSLIDKRNGIKEMSPGDKTYYVPEYSKEFYKNKNRNWRSEKYLLPKLAEEPMPIDLINMLNLNPNHLASLFSNKRDYGYETNPKIEKYDEMNNVKDLDKWRAASPLQIPFKVLDLPDKTIKYRPKVTR